MLPKGYSTRSDFACMIAGIPRPVYSNLVVIYVPVYLVPIPVLAVLVTYL
jgi:hypothetical protein